MTNTPDHQAKSAARFYAVQALFEMEATGAGIEDIRREFLTHRFAAIDEDGTEWADGDQDLFRTLLETAVDRQAKIDQITDATLASAWPIARIDPTIRAIFRAAGAEFIGTATPPRVIIAEYSDIAGAFFPGGKETGMVTAILDRFAKSARRAEPSGS